MKYPDWWKHIKYFKPQEFDCPCCGVNMMQQDFVDRLDKAREIAGIPFRITSGYRCPRHNAQVGGVPHSAHIKGLAADIEAFEAGERWKIITALIKAGFVRLGIGKNFIHVDCDLAKPQKVIWTYYK